MKKFLKRIFAAGMLIAAFSLVSCATTKAVKATAPGMSIEKFEDAMCWKLTNSETNSTVYILGTFHLADERAFPLPDDVLEGLSKANRLVGEIASDDYVALGEKLTAEFQTAFLSMNGVEGDLTEYLTEEECEVLYSIYGDEYYGIYILFQPWVINYELSNALYTSSNLSAQYGYDVVLTSTAMQNGVPVEGLDSIDAQINALNWGTFDEQLFLLKQTLAAFKDLDNTIKEVSEQYETYLSHDAEKMNAIMFRNDAKDMKNYPFLKDYYYTLFGARNEKWAYQIAEYLNEENSTTFIFAGAGHFIRNDSVFHYMMEQGSL